MLQLCGSYNFLQNIFSINNVSMLDMARYKVFYLFFEILSLRLVYITNV